MSRHRMLMTSNRLKVTDGTTSGPSLLEDHIAREKIHRFDHERIPGASILKESTVYLLTVCVERVVHARGAGAHGYFKVYSDAAKKYTFAPVLTDPSRTTSTFVRFSTVQGSRGSAVSTVMPWPALVRADIELCYVGHSPRCPRLCCQVLH